MSSLCSCQQGLRCLGMLLLSSHGHVADRASSATIGVINTLRNVFTIHRRASNSGISPLMNLPFTTSPIVLTIYLPPLLCNHFHTLAFHRVRHKHLPPSRYTLRSMLRSMFSLLLHLQCLQRVCQTGLSMRS